MTRPISTERRVENYRKQTRRPSLTPRQRRRVDKKEGVIRNRRPARS
ncbi:hypothetical protein [Micromonospora sp. HM5-17]|jgi:hypothetical protein|nr:hypothetical protein [Micromonospora sp. HM5-17]